MVTETIIVIPARYRSTRFPGKPLAPLRGADGAERSLIRRSWDAAMAVPGVARVVVATDDQRIADHVRGFGGTALMTSPGWRNGTERCAEVAESLALDPKRAIVINLQGDAPLTPPWFVTALIEALDQDRSFEVATPVLKCDATALAQFRADRRAGRVGGTTAVFESAGRALYFSKEVIPYSDGDPAHPVFHHVGVYAYRPSALADYMTWRPGPLEAAEGLEQLRFLENGARLRCVVVEGDGRPFWEVNNPPDIARVEQVLASLGMP